MPWTLISLCWSLNTHNVRSSPFIYEKIQKYLTWNILIGCQFNDSIARNEILKKQQKWQNLYNFDEYYQIAAILFWLNRKLRVFEVSIFWFGLFSFCSATLSSDTNPPTAPTVNSSSPPEESAQRSEDTDQRASDNAVKGESSNIEQVNASNTFLVG